jgi:hypothetical protein
MSRTSARSWESSRAAARVEHGDRGLARGRQLIPDYPQHQAVRHSPTPAGSALLGIKLNARARYGYLPAKHSQGMEVVGA